MLAGKMCTCVCVVRDCEGLCLHVCIFCIRCTTERVHNNNLREHRTSCTPISKPHHPKHNLLQGKAQVLHTHTQTHAPPYTNTMHRPYTNTRPTMIAHLHWRPPPSPNPSKRRRMQLAPRGCRAGHRYTRRPSPPECKCESVC